MANEAVLAWIRDCGAIFCGGFGLSGLSCLRIVSWTGELGDDSELCSKVSCDAGNVKRVVFSSRFFLSSSSRCLISSSLDIMKKSRKILRQLAQNYREKNYTNFTVFMLHQIY
ncbi:hypothetical protein BpHYR1_042015 [Brachionus plicatilis]|uniref:Uncharacterized protein n=1 Tax=Brachionus plicatilis TaxID=10195 RepID=A0A3M7P7Z6_BRAPC|nr:hypothetical protein BpHYR1_042015 [Brachionus plicatilis]